MTAVLAVLGVKAFIAECLERDRVVAAHGVHFLVRWRGVAAYTARAESLALLLKR
jgi:hypothetical protein